MLNSKIQFIFPGSGVWFLRNSLFLFQHIFSKYHNYPSIYALYFCKTRWWVTFNIFSFLFLNLDMYKNGSSVKIILTGSVTSADM